MVVKEAENPINASRSVPVVPRTDDPGIKQPTFDWKAAHKYQEPLNFEPEVKKMFMTIAITH